MLQPEKEKYNGEKYETYAILLKHWLKVWSIHPNWRTIFSIIKMSNYSKIYYNIWNCTRFLISQNKNINYFADIQFIHSKDYTENKKDSKLPMTTSDKDNVSFPSLKRKSSNIHPKRLSSTIERPTIKPTFRIIIIIVIIIPTYPDHTPNSKSVESKIARPTLYPNSLVNPT